MSKSVKYDVGDKVWCIEDKVGATITKVSTVQGIRSYEVGQSQRQRKEWGAVNWVAWLDSDDLLPYKDRPKKGYPHDCSDVDMEAIERSIWATYLHNFPYNRLR